MTKSAVDIIAEQCLGSRIRLLNRLVTGIYDKALRPHGLRISQANVLVTIGARGPLRASDVCRLLKLEKSTLSRDLERLIENGWVARAPLLAATPAGRRLLAACLPAWRQAQRETRKLLTPDVADAAMQVVQGLWAEEGLSREHGD